MEEGLIIKGYGGFYFVRSGKETWRCRGRGRLRRDGSLLVGDRVLFTKIDSKEGLIEAILPRKNSIQRPPVANVDQMILVVSLAQPEPDLKLLNRTLVLGEMEKLEILICFNKVDLVAREKAESLEEIYRKAGYRTLLTSALEKIGVTELYRSLAAERRISVLAGPSGAGKSTLLNTIDPGLSLATGEISPKLKRGRHTTRYVQLLPIGNGYVADTPGFSNLELPSIKRTELAHYFPEIREYAGKCRFLDCLHIDEPDCEVKNALKRGIISNIRYQDYQRFLGEIIDKERMY
ncbi:ribosome biogenesis GTPase RsgA [Thermacetogenium phaeum DSM 12270]|uniref:Small ribosomal subunit biogenesis GTPase RsgA n=1 Tax=Thermacetogenium phaeum (strain ATCC BAA-254 / DSM 26808 / PB) TaxID=1089553 RepID=K4LF17_THEPS|nr:ribosome small subunit-dependent GTPase A [Thermacetogenium phaeum]AFV11631.1 ribosome biogenesis GTPase RsgA [Thermacetogenium phaeum DSM 12270]MDN5365160.1 ribosome biosis GTPase / thiamine phosphate phosphatase [Thermacetogenium sp.]